jgi:hypothetical protein
MAISNRDRALDSMKLLLQAVSPASRPASWSARPSSAAPSSPKASVASSATPSDASPTARRYTHFLRCASAWSLLRPTHTLCDALPWQR